MDPEEIERERRGRAAMVRANARRGIEANFKEAVAGARFAERFAASFTPPHDPTVTFAPLLPAPATFSLPVH